MIVTNKIFLFSLSLFNFWSWGICFCCHRHSRCCYLPWR